MALPLGLISKSLVGVVSVGAVGGGSWVLWDKGSWTQFDKDVFNATSGWTWTIEPTTDTTPLTSGQEKELKIKATTSSTSGGNKTWECVIKGELPKTLETNAASKISEQLSAIKSAIGTETGGSWKPDNTGDKGDKAKKFFTYCIKNRTWEEWWKAKGGGGEVNSTIHMEIKKYGENTSPEYKFDEEEFKKLYS